MAASKKAKKVFEEEEFKWHFPVVGIGASAGGLEAIQHFFQYLPTNPNVAFIIIQHLSPDYKSLMDELLSRYTKMEIRRVEDGMQVEKNVVYLIPPSKNMTIFKGKLYLTEQKSEKRLNLPVDIFLQSLAQDAGKQAIGVILSGTGSDGTMGVRTIKEYGGMVMVQDDQSAKFDGMPNSSIATGLVDFILPPDKMPEALMSYLQHPFIDRSEDKPNTSKNENVLAKILHFVKQSKNIDFSHYKENTILRRIEKRISINQLHSFEEYLNFLYDDPKEVNTLFKELLIGVTRFFRDAEAFKLLHEKIIPELFESYKDHDTIRIWSVACSTGEEAYSLAILFQEYMQKHHIHKAVKIFATDIDQQSLEIAGTGIYPESVISEINPQRLSKYFNKKREGYQVKEDIRRMVVFAKHNIMKDPPFSKIHLLVCRNVLIYLNSAIQKKILSIFAFSLHDRGYLFLGSSESIGELNESFKTLHTKWKFYRLNSDAPIKLSHQYDLPSLELRSRKNNMSNLNFRQTGQSKESQLEELFDGFLDKLAGPAVIINHENEIIHTFGNLNSILTIPKGKMHFDILKMVSDELAVILSSILRKTRKSKQEVKFENIQLEKDADNIHMRIRCIPLANEKTNSPYFLLMFESVVSKKEELEQDTDQNLDINKQYHERVLELENELQLTKENLQATVEELETSNEELQSSNEELIASNEELQSTNEELQSVNEELYTVNAEHQVKIQELTNLNNDMNNLLSNTNIGSLFLDSNLQIRKFTKLISDITNIMDMDIGRPIHHISLDNLYDSFLDDIDKVMDDLQKRETEIQTKSGDWYLIRIIPYRTEENAINGIIVTFIAINQLKAAEDQVERERNLLRRVLDSSPLGKTMVDKNGTITYLNKEAGQILEANFDETGQLKFDDEDWNITDEKGRKIPSSKLPFSIIMKSKKNLYNYKHYIQKSDGRKKLLSINGAPIYGDDHQLEGAVFTLEDITNNEQ